MLKLANFRGNHTETREVATCRGAYAADLRPFDGMPHQISRPRFHVSVVAIMLFQVAALFARSMLELSLVKDGFTKPVAQDLSFLVVPPILLVLMYPYLKRCRSEICTLFRTSALTLRIVLLSVLLGLTMRITYWAILTVLIWGGVVNNDDPNAITGPIFGFDCPSLPVMFLSLGVMALLIPVIEEVINRGFILHALLPRGVATSVIVSALLFALMHKPTSYILAFSVGVLLAIQVLNYRTLWAPVFAHAGYNAAAVFDWECFRIIWNPPAYGPMISSAAIIAAPVAVAGVALAFFMVSKRAAGTGTTPRRI